VVSAPDKPLFDVFERTDESPSPHSEDAFAFLNRASGVMWERIRTELERWYVAFPLEDAADLRARFRSRQPGQHYAAWWELYLHHVFSRLGFSVEVHPELVDVTARPDFRMTRDQDSFLVEAATTFSGIVEEGRNEEREGWIKDAINRATNPDFFVGLEFEAVGLERPSDREIVAAVEAWLKELDPDVVLASGDWPTQEFSFRDWRIRLRAIPKSPEGRGNRPGDRLLGLGPTTVGTVNDSEKLRQALDRKSGKYGNPSEPIVTAVLLASTFAMNEAVQAALFGSVSLRFDPNHPGSEQFGRNRDGFWMPGERPRGTRVSAVLLGANLMPWDVASSWPRLWPNPWAQYPFNVELPFPRSVGDDHGRVRDEDATASPAASLGLPEGWPEVA
jgi:hypothetical protein